MKGSLLDMTRKEAHVLAGYKNKNNFKTPSFILLYFGRFLKDIKMKIRT